MNCSVFSGEIDNEYHLVLSGYMDTAACLQVQEDIEKAIAGISTDEILVVDLDHLEFISSTGLRILLSLRKRFANLSIINASPSVYEVFEMTGFTRMMTVRKAMRRVNIDDCPEIGRGGVGIVYRLSEDSIIKVFNEGTSLDDVTREVNLAKEAFVLGLPTAMSFDTVKVDTLSGIQYGLVYELLNADTLSNVISQHPEKLDFYARRFAQLYREMHSVEVSEGGTIPSFQENENRALDRIACYFDDSIMQKAHDILALVPSCNRLLHGDLHAKNVMLEGDELMLIDMGEIGYGNPLSDLAHTYSSMMICIGDYELINGLTKEQGHRFFQVMLDEYFKDVPADEKAKNIELIKKLASVRGISWLSLLESVPQEIVDACARQFRELNTP